MTKKSFKYNQKISIKVLLLLLIIILTSCNHASTTLSNNNQHLEEYYMYRYEINEQIIYSDVPMKVEELKQFE